MSKLMERCCRFVHSSRKPSVGSRDLVRSLLYIESSSIRMASNGMSFGLVFGMPQLAVRSLREVVIEDERFAFENESKNFIANLTVQEKLTHVTVSIADIYCE